VRTKAKGKGRPQKGSTLTKKYSKILRERRGGGYRRLKSNSTSFKRKGKPSVEGVGGCSKKKGVKRNSVQAHEGREKSAGKLVGLRKRGIRREREQGEREEYPWSARSVPPAPWRKKRMY